MELDLPLDLLRKMKESAFGPAEVHKGPMGTPERTSGTHKPPNLTKGSPG